ncbi:hypothetical protein PVAG01_06376 [Phlyctema vagabunda]|uniref:Gylcosyl hydrolase 115 C-terminal domain-containing protein n=1 Tax=Phlyctema vagabunda TaxID=108571 RepID=A0ABR4PFX0_9HELO
MKSIAILSAFWTFVSLASALGQTPVITTVPPKGNESSLLQLAGSGLSGQILLSADDWWGVIRAAEDLSIDFGRVTGQNLTLANWQSDTAAVPDAHKQLVTEGGATTVLYTYYPPTSNINYTVGAMKNITGPVLLDDTQNTTVIIAGTIGRSSVISSIIASGKLDVSAITGEWESFISQVVESPLPGIDRALVIAGSDLRGSIFGLYDVSEQIGVSPWYWFADVPPKKHQSIWAVGGQKVQTSPSVKYRGIFINDEQPGLTNWINSNYAPGKYGAGYNHYFYPRVFELLLRLRANYLWPAMWGSMFNVDDYENQPIADAYGIVMGTSHTEPMMRATNEWGTFGPTYGGNKQWQYDTNNASIIPFLTYGTQRAAPYVANSLFTMAMRGNGDTAIDLTQAEAIQVLENVVAKQTEILKEVFPDTNVEDIAQLWCLYKEVQGYFEAGLAVPEYITLLWADDNWGNVRRLPIGNETSRSGGAGLYYHFDYVGDPRDYKWINTIQLEKTLEQLQLAHARQADRIWIVNVGDLKPLELPISHFMDIAYNVTQWGYNSVPAWLEAWATREFSSELASDISSVVDRYGMYAARRKYELVDPTVYSIINYNEADSILAQWNTLAKDAQTIYDKLDTEFQPAFYEMVLQPVLGGQIVHKVHIGVARNEHFTEQKRNSANDVAMQVLADFKTDHTITQRYHDLLDGKWNHMLDQTHFGYNYWQQPMRNALPPLTFVQGLETSLAGDIGVGIEGNNATVSGDDKYHGLSSNTLTLPPIDPYGPATRWIDVFARGTSGCSWNVSPYEDWVHATPSSGYAGTNGSDTRVLLSVDWSRANTSVVMINITSSCANWGNYPSPKVQLPVNATSVPANFSSGFVESDRSVSIEASHFTTKTAVDGVDYMEHKNYGRTLSGVSLTPILAPTQNTTSGPALTYDLYTFTPTKKANVTLYLTPSLNYMSDARALKYAIAFDDEKPQIKQFAANTTHGDLPVGWLAAVADAVWGLSSGNSTTTTHDLTVAGPHRLRLWALEPGVIFQKIVVDLGGVRKSYLGPPESFRVGLDTIGEGRTGFA